MKIPIKLLIFFSAVIYFVCLLLPDLVNLNYLETASLNTDLFIPGAERSEEKTKKEGFYLLYDTNKSEYICLSEEDFLISTVSLGFVIAYANPVLKETAISICETKLLQSPLQTLIRAFFCGILVYMAVSTFREKGTLSGIFLCVPAFVVAGFEHSIANMFYFGAAGIISFESLIYLTIVVLGNSIGGLAMPFLSVIGKASPENA